MTDVKDPWIQLPQESDLNYRYFRKYLEMGPSRTVEKLSKKVKKSTSYLYKLSSDWDWPGRARPFDQHMDQVWLEEFRAKVRSSAQGFATLGLEMIEKANKSLERHNNETDDNGKPKVLSVHEVPRWAEAGAKIVKIASDLGPPVDMMGDKAPSAEDVLPFILEALEGHPEAKAEILARLEMTSK